VFSTLKDAKHYAYVAPTVYQFVAFVQIYCNVAFPGCTKAMLSLNEFIASLVFGYTFSEVAVVFVTKIIKPPSAFGNLTPVLAGTEVTLLISDVNAVAVPWFEPAADILSDDECISSVLTEVMFGCAAVVTVPAVVAVVADPAVVADVALATVPLTLAPATAFAVVANVTAPETLAPVNADNPDPLPVNIPVFAVTAEAVIVPLTPNVVSVPTEVMFG